MHLLTKLKLAHGHYVFVDECDVIIVLLRAFASIELYGYFHIIAIAHTYHMRILKP